MKGVGCRVAGVGCGAVGVGCRVAGVRTCCANMKAIVAYCRVISVLLSLALSLPLALSLGRRSAAWTAILSRAQGGGRTQGAGLLYRGAWTAAAMQD